MQKFYKPSRFAVVYVIMALLLGIYMTTLYKIQIYDTAADENAWLARNTTRQGSTLTANRGDILDRYGNVLVSTRAAYNIALSGDALLDRDDANDIILRLIHSAVEYGISYTDTFPVTQGAPFAYLSDMTDTQKDLLNRYLKRFEYFGKDQNISASDLIIKMKEHYGIDYTTNITDARLIIGVRYEMELRAIKSMNPYVFASDVNTDFLTLLKEQQQKYQGVNIETSAVRVYHTTYAAHLLGYIGKMNAEEYAAYKDLDYSYSSMIGKSGAELAFEKYLHGTDGKQVVAKSDNGTVIDIATIKEPVAGNNVFLSIDIGLQAVCEDSLAAKINLINSERSEEDRVTGGAVVVTDVRTGEVLACCSYPTYDPATFMQNYADLSTNETKPLYNRATMGAYNPGSTFKMVTALSGFKSGDITPATTYTCTGKFTKYAGAGSGFTPYCWNRAGHGVENVVTALRDSCNVFFYWLGDTIGIDAISATATDFGLGAKTGIELPESAGTLATPEYKKIKEGVAWYAADNIITAIGQGYNQFTPLQLANYAATIANGGTRYPMTMLSNIRSADFSTVVYQPEHKALGTVSGSQYIPYLQEGMKLVASAPQGTASSIFKNYQVPVAAKTGTVQTGSTALLNNGVFVCYAPADNPQIAISIVVEKGTSGSTIMEIARDIMDYYFKEKPSISVAQDNTILP